MGNSSQGTVISGQVQGVKSGAGIAIAADGTISVDSQSIVGVMKLGQTAATAAAAYNAYEWPTTTGTVGQQLTISVVGTSTTLAWGDPDGIPWTAKGQLVVGTGTATQALLSVGTDGQILIADSTQTTGLGYTGNFVATTGSTSTALIPAGSTAARPVSPATGAFRYNSSNSVLEFYNGTAWSTVASSSTGLFVDKTSTTGSSIIPAGTTAQRDGSPVAGYFRFNSSNSAMEFYDGTAWNTVAASTTGLFVDKTSSTGSAGMPAGTTAQRDASPATGYTRFNTTTTNLETYDGTGWTAVGAPPVAGLGINISVTGSIIKVSIPTVSTPPVAGALAAQAVDGSLYWDKELGSLFIRYNDGTRVQWVPSTGGTVSSGPLSFPDPTTQTPVNTFSPVSTPIASPNGITYNYNVAKGIWIGGGVPSPATFLEAKTGTLNTVFSSPQTAVPKDASGMTGAALIPGGTDAQRTAITSPVAGMVRYNNQGGTPATTYMEWYDGVAWSALWGSSGPTSGTVVSLAGLSTTTFTVPAGTVRMTIIVKGVSTTLRNSVTAGFDIQLGVGGVVSTSGYLSATGSGSVTGGLVNGSSFYISTQDAGAAVFETHGSGTFSLLTGTTWVLTSQTQAMDTVAGGGSVVKSFCVGETVLTGTLDTVKITATGGRTFVTGEINFLYG